MEVTTKTVFVKIDKSQQEGFFREDIFFHFCRRENVVLVVNIIIAAIEKRTSFKKILVLCP